LTVACVALGAVAWLLAAHAVANRALARRPLRGGVTNESVSILLPVRDEERRVGACVRSLLAQQGLPKVEVIVLDDGSSDQTADVVREVMRDTCGDGPTLIAGQAPPEGWLGKAFACRQLADAASGDVLVFVDADVVLSTDAVAATVTLLRRHDLAWVSPYPAQQASGWLGLLVQPLLTWSWLALLPLRMAEGSKRRSLAAANGQFLIVDAEAYRHAGGHDTVRAEVVEDMALARTLRGNGGRGGFADGAAIARCRMYDAATALVDGYAKSLWTAFGSPTAAVAVSTALVVLYVAPLALVATTPWALLPVAGGIASRFAARRSGEPISLIALLHPLSVVAFAWLVVVSIRRHRRHELTWKGRLLP
jgi:Glycosyl transferase family 2